MIYLILNPLRDVFRSNLTTDGVFSADQDGTAVFHPACDLDSEDFLAVQTNLRKRQALEGLVRCCAGVTLQPLKDARQKMGLPAAGPCC